LTVFADSSAVVKLYADEEYAELVRGVEFLVVSAVARVEVPAALWRKSRMGELPVADAAVLTEAFAHDWTCTDRFVRVAVGTALFAEAAGLVARHGLRAYDGVQLACAVAARRADPGISTVACFDRELGEAVAREGFRLLAC